METSSATNAACPTSRMIIQQCLSAKLEVRPAAADTDAELVQVFDRAVRVIISYFQ